MSPTPDNEYIDRSDEAELARLQGTDGVGEAQFLTHEDVKSYSIADYLSMANEEYR
jgi:hypothetical protein